MRRMRLAGLKCRDILPKAVQSHLGDLDLPYNWSRKTREFVLGICLARSAVLQDIARTRRGLVQKSEKALSEFLASDRLDLKEASWKTTVRMLRRLGLRRFYRYRGKVILIVDSTTYAKLRSRGKIRRMPHIGKVRLHNVPTDEVVLVPGYSELWTGLFLKDKTCLGITRALYTETRLDGPSQNMLEECQIRKAIELVREAFGVGVILVADQGFRRKDLLEWLKHELRIDFVIRIGGKLLVRARGWDGLLSVLAPHWEERLRRHWRDTNKDPILSEVRGASVTATVDRGKRVRFNVVCLTPVNRKELDAMFLATTLPIETREELSRIVSLYSNRWSIETFFFSFKQSLRAHDFRVFSRWEAIDRLLAMAHLAFLLLYLLYVLGQEATHGIWAAFWRRARDILRWRCARPPEMTLGKFFEVLADDFAQRSWARELP